jgi:beta-lactamase regulating signal transducer with metallopeptidase domain
MDVAGFFFDALRALVLFGTTLVAVAALGKSAAATTRRAVLVAAIVATALSPLAVRALSAVRAPTLVELRFASFAPASEPEGVGTIAVPAESAARHDAAGTIDAEGSAIGKATRGGVTSLLVAVWMLGASVLLARLGWGVVGASLLARRARRAAVRRFAAVIARTLREANVVAEVAISDDIDTPAVTGVLRPVVLMPRAALGWDDGRWRVVLLHELAHVRRRDCLVGIVAQLVCAAHWFDPLVWITRARWQVERELAADEDVLARGVRPSDYAEHLLDVASAVGEREVPAGALAMADRASGLAYRLETIVQRGTPKRPSPRTAGAIVAAASALTLALACAGPRDPAAPHARSAGGADSRNAPRESRATAPSTEQAKTDTVNIAEQVARVIGGSAERNELTIDPRLQIIAEEETAHLMSTFHPRQATAIILDPAKGEILALANPDAARQAYITGSTMKTLTIAAALDAGVVRGDQKLDCQPRPGESPALSDTTPHGWLDPAEILEVSSNVGALRVYQLLGDARFDRAVTRFHLADERFPVQLKFAPFSALPSARSGSLARGEAGGAVGDGFVSTPIQMVTAYAVFANGGEYVAPSLVRSMRDEAGRIYWTHAPKREPVLRAETAKAMLEMLERAVDGRNATGKAARVQGLRVAGKTGTSQLHEPNASQVYASFIGIVPVDAPRYVILVSAVDPAEGQWGGTVAAPTFARIAARALALPAPNGR